MASADIATGAQIAALKGHAFPVNSAVFSGDGKLVLTAALDGTARLWNATTGEEIANFKGNQMGLNNAVFSPDGTRVATSGLDGTARFWDAATGAQLAPPVQHGRLVQSVGFSPDGRRVVTASADGTAGIWDVSGVEQGDAFEIACARLGRATDLSVVQDRYGLGELAPICGDHPPAPVDLAKLQ